MYSVKLETVASPERMASARLRRSSGVYSSARLIRRFFSRTGRVDDTSRHFSRGISAVFTPSVAAIAFKARDMSIRYSSTRSAGKQPARSIASKAIKPKSSLRGICFFACSKVKPRLCAIRKRAACSISPAHSSSASKTSCSSALPLPNQRKPEHFQFQTKQSSRLQKRRLELPLVLTRRR